MMINDDDGELLSNLLIVLTFCPAKIPHPFSHLFLFGCKAFVVPHHPLMISTAVTASL